MAATSRKSSEATFKWSGRGGGQILDHTTPSARTNAASRPFLMVQPPLLLLRRGADPAMSLFPSPVQTAGFDTSTKSKVACSDPSPAFSTFMSSDSSKIPSSWFKASSGK